MAHSNRESRASRRHNLLTPASGEDGDESEFSAPTHHTTPTSNVPRSDPPSARHPDELLKRTRSQYEDEVDQEIPRPEIKKSRVQGLGRGHPSPGPGPNVRFTVPPRARPTAVENKRKFIRVPRGNDNKAVGLRERILGAVRGRIHKSIDENQVRLLIVDPGSGDEEINASLLSINDDELGGDRYPYEALSYHWGEGAEDNVILINKWGSKPIKKLVVAVDAILDRKKAEGNRGEDINVRTYRVRENLYEALKQLRHPTDPTPLWVDALCIDQSNEVEKTKQVKKMGHIYHKAERVCIWLGTGDAESDQAMDFIKNVIDEALLPDLLSKSEYIPRWISLYRLLEWSWFTRRWVIQELALSRQATVHCGKKHAHWDDFRDAIGIFHRYFDSLKYKMRNYDPSSKPIADLEFLGAQLLVDLSSNVFRANDDGTYQSTKSLEMLVSQLSGFDTADPRDTIHALRNISREGYRFNTRHDGNVEEQMPESSYAQDLFEVYQKFVQWTVKTSDSLDIICRHWALPERKKKGPTTPYLIQKLPTWIKTVDKSSFGRGSDVYEGRRAGESFVGLPGKSVYTASGRKTARVKFGEYKTTNMLSPRPRDAMPIAGSQPAPQNMTLSAFGLLIGRVSATPISIPDGVIPRDCLERLGWTEEKAAAEEIEAAPAKLWRTLVADRGPKGEYAPTYYHRACLNCLLNQTVNGHLNAKELLLKIGSKDEPNIARDYLERVLAVTWNRSILEAESLPKNEKLVGLAPPKARADDVIAILYGCSVPVILRPVGKTYELIGESYIYGKMDGEAVREKLHEEKWFELI